MINIGLRISLFVACVILATCQQNAKIETNFQHVDYEVSSGQKVFSFADSVPIFRKNGVLWKHGASYRSVLSAPLIQNHAEFDLYEKSGVIAWTPNTGPITQTTYAYFDGTLPEGAEVFPFINVGRTLYVVQGDSEAELCSDENSLDTQEPSNANVKALINSFSNVDDRFFRFLGSEVMCVTADRTDSGAWMVPIETSQSPEAIGFLFRGKKNQTLRINDFHLGTNADLIDTDFLVVKAEETIDGVVPSKLNILTYEGKSETLSNSTDGKFKLSRDIISNGPFRIWVEENGLDVFSTQGEWIDPEGLTANLTIKQNVEFEIDPTKKNKSAGKRRKIPHNLSIWNGSSSKMKVQEYEGISFTNNWGKIDRDRHTENENGCLRGAFFGGSYVELEQTKISEKPGLMAEAFASQSLGRCVEIFTYGKSLNRAENFINDATKLIDNFDIDFAIFSVSRLELCQHNDGFYNQWHGRDLSSPKHWRVIDGQPVAPVAQGDANTFKPNKDAAKKAIQGCKFNSTELSETEVKPLEKMKAIETILTAKKPDLKVVFFNFKDVLSLNEEVVSNFLPNCDTVELNCKVLPVPESYEFDEDHNRFSPYLYRYKNDGHPNIRANQYISDTLADIVVQNYSEIN